MSTSCPPTLRFLSASLLFFAVSALAEPLPPASKALDDWFGQPAAQRPAVPPATPLDLAEAKACRERLWQFVRDEAAPAHAAELEAKVIEIDGAKLRWMERVFGKEPAGGHSLWISMHGGGGAPTKVNDSQWQNQIRLYEPAEGIYIAPRAPSDAWDLWHQDDVTHDRFYWLGLPPAMARKGQDITAEIRGSTIEITTKDVNTLVLRLADDLLNLDAPVTVRVNGVEKFAGHLDRTAPAILRSLRQRFDPTSAAFAEITVTW